MILEYRHKFYGRLNWQPILSAFALGLGTVGLCSPVEAMSQITAKESPPLLENKIQATSQTTDSQADFQLAQVGVRSRINGPTPLNITPPPGTHIPLPASNYHHRGYHHHPYRRARRKYIHHRRSSRYDRHQPYYDGYRHHSHRSRRYKKGSRVIIINPATHDRYNHNSSYIRVIRR
ncbi:hypothetical protein [Pleurocapsa sp. PCC 7319]|uniref:hypothetical protein n=1 Tax=Pleurocapsa sp. PCC 7319 TaxID=118161 RepID=UPI0003487AE7|nr:hypothetical protein [Pleurocapsa sp. PCC 7319]